MNFLAVIITADLTFQRILTEQKKQKLSRCHQFWRGYCSNPIRKCHWVNLLHFYYFVTAHVKWMLPIWMIWVHFDFHLSFILVIKGEVQSRITINSKERIKISLQIAAKIMKIG